MKYFIEVRKADCEQSVPSGIKKSSEFPEFSIDIKLSNVLSDNNMQSIINHWSKLSKISYLLHV